MKILLAYFVIGLIVTASRLISVSIMTKGKFWSWFKNRNDFGKFIFFEIIIGTLIWPLTAYSIIKSLIMIGLKRYDRVDDLVEVGEKLYFE